MSVRRGILILVTLVATGCGGRSIFPAGDGGSGGNNNGNQNANLNTNLNSNHNTNSGECSGHGDCVVARKWDVCCSCPESASPADLAADDCLIPLVQSYVPEHCYVDCPAMPCPLCPTYGRTPACNQGSCGWAEGNCTEDDECVVAIRTDNCCEAAFPASKADVEGDLCLAYYAGYWQDVPQECYERWDPECAYIDCMPAGPSSRAVNCSSDGCAYVDECVDRSDCIMMVNARECCACAEPWPASMAGRDPCVTTPTAPVPADCRPAACDGVLCEPCGPYPDIACESGTCVGLYWYQ